MKTDLKMLITSGLMTSALIYTYDANRWAKVMLSSISQTVSNENHE